MTDSPFVPSLPAPAPGDHPGAVFFRTRFGALAAIVADTGYLLVPGRAAGLAIASIYRKGSDPEGWDAASCYSIVATVDSERGFRAHVNEQAEHTRELEYLDRREIRGGASTPWGVAQTSCRYAEGIVFHSTAGHGGFHLESEANLKVRPRYRNDGGWYEEDSQWAKVAKTFPHLFSAFERTCADRTLRHDEPDAYEAVTGTIIPPGGSFTKDRRAFLHEHATDWIVISAIQSASEQDRVECVAAIGGDRSSTDQRRFLVPASEYRVGPFGFVIDETRHPRYEGLSSFPVLRNGKVA